jgi:hypothetical protein
LLARNLRRYYRHKSQPLTASKQRGEENFAVRFEKLFRLATVVIEQRLRSYREATTCACVLAGWNVECRGEPYPTSNNFC